MSNYDLIIVGSGPGGYVAAIRAAHNGLKVALVEKESKLGGTCLLRGCIPTKSLLHSADVLQEVRDAKAFGVTTGEIGFDFAKVQKARAKQVTKGAAGVAYLMKQNKIDVHSGAGRFKDAGTIEVDGKRLKAKHVIIATGSVPKSLPSLKLDGKRVITSNEALELSEPPASMLVLGAGAVGVELASIYSRFGTECTIVEMLDRVLPIEDTEISAEVEKLLEKRRINILTGTRLEKAVVGKESVVATVAGAKESTTIEAAVVLVAVGRPPYTEGLGLDANGQKPNDRGFIEVDELMRTKIDGVFAIGDVVPTPQLAHIASAEAMLAVDQISGKKVEPINYRHTPSCTYSDPEVGSVGLTERAAIEKGYTVKIGKFPFAALGKARVMGNIDGFVKVIADAKYDELLGVHIVGPRATDLIAEASVALRLESTAEELARTIHAHPTLPEAVLEAAHAALGRAIHL